MHISAAPPEAASDRSCAAATSLPGPHRKMPGYLAARTLTQELFPCLCTGPKSPTSTANCGLVQERSDSPFTSGTKPSADTKAKGAPLPPPFGPHVLDVERILAGDERVLNESAAHTAAPPLSSSAHITGGLFGLPMQKLSRIAIRRDRRPRPPHAYPSSTSGPRGPMGEELAVAGRSAFESAMPSPHRSPGLEHGRIRRDRRGARQGLTPFARPHGPKRRTTCSREKNLCRRGRE